jgi:hypothetical protein
MSDRTPDPVPVEEHDGAEVPAEPEGPRRERAERPGAFTGGERPSGSGRGSNTDGANMSDEAAAPADPSRGA